MNVNKYVMNIINVLAAGVGHDFLFVESYILPCYLHVHSAIAICRFWSSSSAVGLRISKPSLHLLPYKVDTAVLANKLLTFKKLLCVKFLQSWVDLENLTCV